MYHFRQMLSKDQPLIDYYLYLRHTLCQLLANQCTGRTSWSGVNMRRIILPGTFIGNEIVPCNRRGRPLRIPVLHIPSFLGLKSVQVWIPIHHDVWIAKQSSKIWMVLWFLRLWNKCNLWTSSRLRSQLTTILFLHHFCIKLFIELVGLARLIKGPEPLISSIRVTQNTNDCQ